MFFFWLAIDLPRLLGDLYRLLTGQARGLNAFRLQQWAEERDMEIVVLKPCGRPPDSVAEQFPFRMRAGYRYFRITTIDPDHVRRSGVARVHGGDSRYGLEQVIDLVWLTSEQLNRRDQPPRRSARLPDDRAEGWYTDHTGAHEQRWYSVGTPTDLVKDGAIESRDPPRSASVN
jgi:hypothetical protein